MWKAFSKLAEANVDHYNNHKTEHYAILAVYSAAIVAGGVAWVRHLRKSDPLYHS